ncbi:MAG: N-formylglutamate amidohydrolase [Alphaproteobacteria bacterium]|nr:N-formylglutamate amidohydrolase [Alphaproteobacteria bacterium]
MTLLGPADPPAVHRINPDGRAPILFVSDHDANAVAAALDTLGLPPEELARHVGYDIGIAHIARRLSARFDAPLIASGYSRLVVDPNRWPGTAGSIPEAADGTTIPGNRNLTDDARSARLDSLFHPYHAAIAETLDAMIAHGPAPLFIALHSFTPALRSAGGDRPWEIGFLWDTDDRASALAIAAFRRRFPDVNVGANQPYSGSSPEGYTVPVHAKRRGLHDLTLEFRQDLIATPEGGDLWADRFAVVLDDVLANSALIQ